ncbi:acyl-CoA synthetase [Microtetraspora malaysiensis]|uniref:Acyl-CoA synthetase n=1 Tax=Microtetraspora malaysiensis TaxID=161358 RepID=A0ABW6SSB7_9ACTN
MTVIRGSGFDDERQAWQVPELYNISTDVADWHSPDALAMVWADYRGEERLVSWGEMRDLSCRFATAYHAAGVRPGEVVAVLLPALPETAAAFLGAYRAGAVLLTMSVLWSDEQIDMRLKSSECRVVLTDRENAARLDTVGDMRVLILEDRPQDTHPGSFPAVATRADDPAQLYYTSGTSGPAKGILHAHRNLIGHNEFEYCHGLRPGEVFYGAGEWAWSYAKLMGPWRYGAAHLVYRHERGFEPNGLLRAMSRHGVSNALVNPTLLRIIRSEADPAALRLPQKFGNVCSSNEPLTPDTLDWFQDVFGVPVLEYYGLTESYPLLGNFPGEPVLPGSTGKPLPGWDVRLLDEDGSPVAAGDAGEICLRARHNPQYPLGIWRDPERTRKIFGGEWFHTGDTARQDADGHWFFLGRNDDLIKSSGYRVGPYEVEEVLNLHPAVKESGVVGLPDPRRGQVVHAFVALRPGGVPSDELATQLQEWVKEKHSRFAYPRGVTFVEELPKSATGKVQRAALRARGR